MGREKGTSSFSANFEPQKSAPLDARSRVEYKSDLCKTSIWEANDGYVYTYRGMIVSVYNDIETNNGLYRLTDENFQDINNQEKLGKASIPLDSTVVDISEIHFYINTNHVKKRYMHQLTRIPTNLHGYTVLRKKTLKRQILRTSKHNTGVVEIKNNNNVILTISLDNAKYATGFDKDIMFNKNDNISCYIDSKDGLDKPILTLQLI